MDPLFQELISVNSDSAFEFFFSGLREITCRRPNNEMHYVAGVLARYSETPRYDASGTLLLADLSEVFDQFVFLSTADPEILEIGGSQLLLFAGFFRDQAKSRHNVNWYDKVGQCFYDRASTHSGEAKKRFLFERMSDSFPEWALICRDLNRSFRDNRFLLRLN